ncbi:MAG: nitrate- and nitrite sensing domain-containing protein, partial [Epsilonproteobacteria bacterium]|nr:nitrate- and nitrite sensing domain-containing protein [Campylobacterota bacterium]
SQALIKLNRKAFKQKPQTIFAAYTEQIEQTLMLAQSVSKRFAKDLTPFGKEISAAMMEIMLPMTEYTERLRGMGAGIAAKGKVTKAQIQEMQALVYELRSANKKLQNTLSKIIASYPNKLPQTISNELAKVNKGVKNYTAFTQKKLLKEPNKVNADSYFDNGTKLIEDIIAVYDTSNKAIMEDAKGWL